MNTYAAPTLRAANTRTRPRRIADLLVVPDVRSIGEVMIGASDTHSSSHWVALTRDPHAGRRAPAHVDELARELGVETRFAWDALDDMYR